MGTEATRHQQDVDGDVVEAAQSDELRHDGTEGSRALVQGQDQLLFLHLVLTELLAIHNAHAVHAEVQLVAACKQYNQSINQCSCVSMLYST